MLKILKDQVRSKTLGPVFQNVLNPVFRCISCSSKFLQRFSEVSPGRCQKWIPRRRHWRKAHRRRAWRDSLGRANSSIRSMQSMRSMTWCETLSFHLTENFWVSKCRSWKELKGTSRNQWRKVLQSPAKSTLSSHLGVAVETELWEICSGASDFNSARAWSYHLHCHHCHHCHHTLSRRGSSRGNHPKTSKTDLEES